jgi:hypothetical protein
MIVFAALMLASDAFADSTTLNAVANQATVSSGASLSVNVNISNVADLYDYQLDLTFNPNVVSAIGVTEGAFFQIGGSTFFIPGTIDNSAGSITFNADTLLSAISGVTGGGTLVVFDFTALSPGTSTFTIENEILQDSTAAVLSDATTSGSVTVQGSTAVPEPSGLLLLSGGALGLVGLALKQATA